MWDPFASKLLPQLTIIPLSNASFCSFQLIPLCSRWFHLFQLASCFSMLCSIYSILLGQQGNLTFFHKRREMVNEKVSILSLCWCNSLKVLGITCPCYTTPLSLMFLTLHFVLSRKSKGTISITLNWTN